MCSFKSHSTLYIKYNIYDTQIVISKTIFIHVKMCKSSQILECHSLKFKCY